MNKAGAFWSVFTDRRNPTGSIGDNQGEIIFSHHVFLFPQSYFRGRAQGEGTLHCFVIWKSPPKPPPSVQGEPLWSKYCTYPITEGGGGAER